ncbi:MAG: ABC transporter permease subunit, partial [Gemmataceae bacterium]
LAGPVVIPATVLGAGLLPVLQSVGGQSILGLVLVHAMLALPLVVWWIVLQCDSAWQDQVSTARGCGARPWQAWRHVGGPLLVQPLAAAWVLAAVLSWNEAIVTPFLATARTETLPSLAWPQLRFQLSPLVAVAAVVQSAVVLSAIVLGSILLRRRLRQW